MPIEAYIKEPARRTPGIVVKPGRIYIMGRSIPDNPGELYGPVLERASDYIRDYEGTTSIDLGFEYLNTSSTKWIFLIIRTLTEKKNPAGAISVKWHYEEGDDDMTELGLMLRSLVECRFELIEVPKMDQNLYSTVLSCGA